MSDLRTRIAAIVDREVDGIWEPLPVADQIIAELGLRTDSTQIPTGCPDCGPMLMRRHVTEWEPANE